MATKQTVKERPKTKRPSVTGSLCRYPNGRFPWLFVCDEFYINSRDSFDTEDAAKRGESP